MKRFLLSLCVTLAALGGINAPVYAKMSAALAVQGEAMQPAGFPILLTLTLTNTGDKALTYWCGGPDTYPGAEHFSVNAVGKDGKLIPLSASLMPASYEASTGDIYNGQYSEGSGMYRDIRPGMTITVPFAISPLPPGEYVLHFHSQWEGPPKPGSQARPGNDILRILVKQDGALRAAREQALLARVRHGEPFAENVVTHYNLQPVIEQLLPDLASDDADMICHAAATLLGVTKLPAGASAQISRGVQKHLHDTHGNVTGGEPLFFLTALAPEAQSPETLEAMVSLVHSNWFPELRWRATQSLGQFHQARARTEMHTLLADPQSAVRGAAAVALAQRHDTAALPVLLALARKHDLYTDWNPIYSALAHFPKNTQAAVAIRAVARSTDTATRWQAQDAQRQLREAHRAARRP